MELLPYKAGILVLPTNFKNLPIFSRFARLLLRGTSNRPRKNVLLLYGGRFLMAELTYVQRVMLNIMTMAE